MCQVEMRRTAFVWVPRATWHRICCGRMEALSAWLGFGGCGEKMGAGSDVSGPAKQLGLLATTSSREPIANSQSRNKTILEMLAQFVQQLCA
ncbi:hypothetical protein CLOM_g3957 [Closterium sp. NIES-68]|nr:hypothetical protein CLOM_g3957 [Closterium sp. NIES-68]